VILALAVAALAGAPARDSRTFMGAAAEISVTGLEHAAPALQAAFAALQDVEDRLSLWKPSELGRLNAAGGAAVSPALRAVLSHALELAAASGGAYDPTLEPLVRAAGGYGGPRRGVGGGERRRLLARVGAGKVGVDASGRVQLAAGAALDLSGLARGYAVDQAVEALRGTGASAGLVDVGGSSLRVFGAPLTLGLRGPEGGESAWGTFTLADAALGVSRAEPRGLPILDPRTGEPARQVLSALVIAASAMEADGLSTALYVLGGAEGLRLVQQRGAAGAVLVRERGRPVVWTTAGFPDTYRLETAPRVLTREERVRP